MTRANVGPAPGETPPDPYAAQRADPARRLFGTGRPLPPPPSPPLPLPVLTAAELFERVSRLPPHERRLAQAALEKKYGTPTTGVTAEDLARRETYLRDPVFWITTALKEFAWSKQRAIMESVRDNRRTAAHSAHSTGKCVEESERIQLADGRVVAAKDLVGRFFSVLAFTESGKQEPTLAWADDNGVCPVFRLTTGAGRQVTRTGNHPLYAAKRSSKKSGATPRVSVVGWTAVSDLEVGDLILVPDSLDASGKRPVLDDHVKLLGYLLGDGGTTVGVAFTQKDGPTKDEFIEIVERSGGRASRRGEYGVYCYGYSTAIADGGKAVAGSNPVLNLVREWGLDGKKSKNKTFPDFVWELPNNQLAILLNRLFACDGWAYVRKCTGSLQAQIGISLASERMIRDVELALLRLGICGRVRQRMMKCNGKLYPAWEWSTTRAAELLKFASVVGIFGKEGSIEAAVAVARRMNQRNTMRWHKQNAPDGYHWQPVKSVERLENSPTVTISVDKHHTFVTTVVEHNSFIAARVVAWWIESHPPGTARVVTSASTGRQIKAALWHEIGRAHGRGNLSGRLNQTEWWVPSLTGGKEEMAAFGHRPQDIDPTAFQGIHARYVLVVLDEACDFPTPLWSAADTLIANEESRILAIGNPDVPETEFCEVCKPGSGWNVIGISAFDTPNFTGEVVPDELRHVLIGPTWVEEKKRKWGETNPLYISKVLGQFPEVSSDGLIPVKWIRAAQERELVPGEPNLLGMDVGAGGNKSVIAHRRGDVVRIIRKDTEPDTMRSCGNLLRDLRTTGAIEARVDYYGVGQGVVDRAKEQKKPVTGVKVGKPSSDPEQFVNLRAEGYWGLRERFQDGLIDIDPTDDDLAAQLASLKFKSTSKGALQIESKDEIRRSGRPSPDEADGVMLVFLNLVRKKRKATWGSGRLGRKRARPTR